MEEVATFYYVYVVYVVQDSICEGKIASDLTFYPKIALIAAYLPGEPFASHQFHADMLHISPIPKAMRSINASASSTRF